METINLTLSAPPLTPSALQVSKVYLFLLSTTSKTSSTGIISNMDLRNSREEAALVFLFDLFTGGGDSSDSDSESEQTDFVDTSGEDIF